MRILLSAQQALRQHAVPAYSFWRFYFTNGLKEAGHEILEIPGVDWAEGLTSIQGSIREKWLDETWSRTLKFIRREHEQSPVDMFLTYLFPDQVEPSAINAIRELGIPCVNFFCDNVREFRRVPESYRAFDLHWVPEAGARELYSQAGLPFIYAPMPVWVPPSLRTMANQENSDITFVGSHDSLREQLLADCSALGLKFRLIGSGWLAAPQPTSPSRASIRTKIVNQFSFYRSNGLRGFVMRATYQIRRRTPRDWIKLCWEETLQGDEYFRVTRESQIVLGINRYPSFQHPFSNPGRYSRLRDIEAPMLGACYLTEWAPGLEDLYDLETEIATYTDADSLVEMTSRLRADPDVRRSLRQAGQRRALAEHTLGRSIQRIARRIQ